MAEKNNDFYTLVIPFATGNLEGVFDLEAVVYVNSAREKDVAQTRIYLPKLFTDQDISNSFFSSGIPVTISVGNKMNIISNGKSYPFEDAPLPEKYAIVFHEMNHVVITYNPYIYEVRKSLLNYLDPLTNNLLHDFIVDTIGSALQNENTMMKMTLQDVRLDEYHYFNYLKSWQGFIGDLARFLYGYVLEDIDYPFPQIPGLGSSYDKFVEAWKELRDGIKELKQNIELRVNDYFSFWKSKRMFSTESPTAIMRDLKEILDKFNQTMEQISYNIPPKSQSIDELLEKAERKDSISQHSGNKDFQNSTEIIFVDDNGNEKSDSNGSMILKTYLERIKQVTAMPKNDVGNLQKMPCPPEIRSYAKQLANKLINQTKFKAFMEQANVYGHNVILGKQEDFSEGDVNIDRIVDNYAAIRRGRAENVPFYDSYHTRPLPRMSIMVVCDVSGSMQVLNETLKPFLSAFYLEGLHTLFDIHIVDFSESVVKEPELRQDTSSYYCNILGEGGTDPFAIENLSMWKKIIAEVKPEIVLFYSDFNYDCSLLFGSNMSEEDATLRIFNKFGIPDSRIFLFNVDDICRKSSFFYFNRTEDYKKFLEEIAEQTVSAIVQAFNKFRNLETTR